MREEKLNAEEMEEILKQLSESENGEAWRELVIELIAFLSNKIQIILGRIELEKEQFPAKSWDNIYSQVSQITEMVNHLREFLE